MPKRGKQYQQNSAGIDRTVVMNLDDGLEAALKCKFAKFDESLDVAIRLGVDPRHADQMVRSSLVLPNGTGKTDRVMVFAKGAKVQEALDAGADFAGGDEFVEKIQGGWLEFDKTIATPDMMGTVGKIGRVLGPRNLMPNAKLGTVTFDVGRVVKEIKGGKIDFRVDKAGIVHAMVGRSSFGVEKLRENVVALIDRLLQLKPSTSKGIYLRSISLSTTMGPGFKIDPIDIRNQIKQAA
ncbi:MAG: 50S ribosomal protein L1 [Proteobacteria bacterium]|nr:50S ribosomal protein L1 [Pseudomonadota bacterium]MBU1687452.1 50S ribosomal protein L1 [Pseudomonadota bacterium]